MQKIDTIRLRVAIGILGLLLPWIVVPLVGQFPPSISATWYTVACTPFMIILGAASILLMCYKGYEKVDDIINTATGLAGLGICLFPCSFIEKDGTNYLFIIPSDSESSFVLYNDDGNSEQYKSGAFAETIFTLNKSSIKASTSGKDEFLCKEFTLVVPKGFKVTGEWNKSGRFMTRKVTLDELKEVLNKL